MALHTDVQALKPEPEQEAVHRCGRGAEVTHQLCGSLGDKGALKTELFSIHDAVIAVIRRGKTGEFICVGKPVKLTRIHDCTANSSTVTVHVFRGGVGNDIGTELEGAAVDGRCKGIIHDQRNAVSVGGGSKLFKIKDIKRGVRDGFAEHGTGFGAECGIQLLGCAVGRHEGKGDTHTLHRNGKEIIGTAVKRRGRHNVVTCASDVEDGKEVCRLTRGGQHSGRAPLKRRNAGGYRITGRILQAGIEIAACLKVKELSHILTGFITEGGALHDRNLAGLTVLRAVPTLYAKVTFASWAWDGAKSIGKAENDWEIAAIGDFAGDGIDDIVVMNSKTGYMYAWENGNSSKSRWVGAVDAGDWEVAAVGDYNGDGKDDLLLRELITGWGGLGYWGGANADNWVDLNARVENNKVSNFAVIA